MSRSARERWAETIDAYLRGGRGPRLVVQLVDAGVGATRLDREAAEYLAGLGVGFWDSPDAVARNWRADRRFEPRMSRDEADSRMARWARAVERSRDWHVEA